MCIATSISNKFVSFRRRFHIEETHFSVHSCSKEKFVPRWPLCRCLHNFQVFWPPSPCPCQSTSCRPPEIWKCQKYFQIQAFDLPSPLIPPTRRFFIFLVIWQMSVQMPVSMGSRHRKRRVIQSPKSILLPDWRRLCVNHMITNDCLWPHFNKNLRCFE